MTTFRAFQVDKTVADGGAMFSSAVVTRAVDDLPPNEVLVDVAYSSLNYKDALSATGNPGVTRDFPHTPGIDAAGVVVASEVAEFAPGDQVIVIGFDLGMGTAGGFAERIRVPAGWIVPLPAGLTLREAMILGTAGFTAALCVHKLQALGGMAPGGGPVLVTGATGGVGSVAVKLLAKLGYEVCAGTGKSAQHGYLRELGATEVMGRDALLADAARPLGRPTWGGVVDTVGGPILAGAVKSLRYGASAAACGLAASPHLPGSVLPFILRHVNLLGVDSAELPLAAKAEVWRKLAGPWRLDGLGELARTLTLGELPAAIDQILAGGMVGRCLVDPKGE